MWYIGCMRITTPRLLDSTFRAAISVPCLWVAGIAVAQPLAEPGTSVTRYDSSKLVRVEIDSMRDLRMMEHISDDMWSHGVRNNSAEYLVTPEGFALLQESGLPFQVLIQNVQELVDSENARLSTQASLPEATAPSFYADYKTAAQIWYRLESLAAAHPETVNMWTFGQSIEGRDMRAISISRPAKAGSPCKPVMFVNGLQHAREWINVMSTVYYIEQIMTNPSNDPRIDALLDRMDFVFVPISNPDGFEYTWTTERFWRKNRRDNKDGTFGVDLNRNWNYQWGVSLPHGSAGNNNTNSAVYWGPAPFSEPESTAIANLLLQYPNVRAALDVHSYGQLLLHPWGYTPDGSPDDSAFNAIGLAMKADIAALYGKNYNHGRSYTAIYPTSGASIDWYYAIGGAWAFTFELRGPSFAPPPNQILPCAEETFLAMLRFAEMTADEFQFIADWDHDCQHTVFDFIDFNTDFVAGELRCDLNNDGTLNVLDYIEFNSLYAQRR